MLTAIHIRDFALIEALTLDLQAGMTTLTGATGAGKSILIDAIGLVLGDRADSDMVRSGARRAQIDLEVALDDLPEVRAWLAERELGDAEAECHLRRIINADGRSKAYINTNPCNRQALRDLGRMLVDIHGQHAHHSLTQRESQRYLLDNYLDAPAALNEVAAAYGQWQTLKQKLQRCSGSAQDQDARCELLQFQVAELDDLALGDNELSELEAEQARLSHAEQLLATAQFALQALYDQDEIATHNQLSSVIGQLEDASAHDAELSEPLALLTEARIQISEATTSLRRYSDHLMVDPERLQWLEQRLTRIYDLARKHRVEPAELPALRERLAAELEQLQTARAAQAELAPQLAAAEARYRDAAAALSGERQRAATELGERVSSAMQALGMAGGQFAVDVQHDAQATLTPQGNDRVEFQVSANPGQPLKSLAKVASGGELARISLAIQMIAVSALTIPTLIFDEVDSGIGGGIAEIVGQQLALLGRQRQVLCVTHLPQVAAQADHHLQVSKYTGAGSTATQIQWLESGQRIQEIARMLGGVELTDATLAHAKDMLKRSRVD